MSTPRIYAACLSSYVAGKLHGAWIDCDQDADDIRAEIALMLKGSTEPGAEEYAIHDHEGWGPIRLGEHEDIDKLSMVARLTEEHGEHVLLLLSAHGWEYHNDEDTLRELVEEKYHGHYEDLEDFGLRNTEDAGIPDWIESYFDFEHWAKDQLEGGALSSVDDPKGGFHVYRNC